MQDLGKIQQLIVDINGYTLKFNLDTIYMTWIVIILLLVFGFFAARKSGMLPRSIQVLGELLVSAL